jgi:hypothetical protein
VLLNRLVNSVKLPRFALDVENRFSVALRCNGEAVAVRVPSSDTFPPADCDGESMLLGTGTIPASCG